jgi:hypothetical protein
MSAAWAFSKQQNSAYSTLSSYYMVDPYAFDTDVYGEPLCYINASINDVVIGATLSDNLDTTVTVVDVGEVYYENRGVITYMEDEFGNKANYDFKNALISLGWGTNLDGGYYGDYILKKSWNWGVLYYTFTGYDKESDASLNTDHSVLNNTIIVTDPEQPSVAFLLFNNQSNYVNNNILLDVDSLAFLGSSDYNYMNSCYQCIFETTAKVPTRANNIYPYSNKIILYCMQYSNIYANCSEIAFGRANCINIGAGCGNIIFGTSEGTKDYYKNITIDSGNQYIYLNRTTTGSSSAYVQNITVHKGVNTTTTWKQIDIAETNNAYEIEYKNTNSIERTV